MPKSRRAPLRFIPRSHPASAYHQLPEPYQRLLENLDILKADNRAGLAQSLMDVAESWARGPRGPGTVVAKPQGA